MEPPSFAVGSCSIAKLLNRGLSYSDPYGLCPIPPSSCLGRDGADLALGSTPVVSTLLDAATVLTGKNLVTGEDASRLVALAGVGTPAGAAHIRGIDRVAEKLTERFGPALSAIIKERSGALHREWVNAKSGMKHILRGPETDQIRPGGPKVKHWNYTQQVPGEGGRYKDVNNVHLDENGDPIN